MLATRQTILDAARHEWTHWGESTWNLITGRKHVGHRDDETRFARRVLEKYCAVGGGNPPLIDIQDDRYFWSAVGVSAMMKSAGFDRREFPFAQSHSVFIRHFIAARRNNDRAAAYWGFRQAEAGGQPDVGDIVAYARGSNMTQSKAAAFFDRTTRYDSHSDVVVARRAGEIDVIGANVLDSVTRKTLALDSDGHIRDTQHHWFAVLKFRGQ
jgi:hypothetical protein